MDVLSLRRVERVTLKDDKLSKRSPQNSYKQSDINKDLNGGRVILQNGDSGYGSRPSTSISSVTKRSLLSESNKSSTRIARLSKSANSTNSTHVIKNRWSSSSSSPITEYPHHSTSSSALKADLSSRSSGSTSPVTDHDKELRRLGDSSRPSSSRRSSSIEPRSLSQWKAYMNTVAAKVDSYRKTKHGSSSQSADMLKDKTVYQVNKKETETPSVAAEAIDSVDMSQSVSDLRAQSRLTRSRPWKESSAVSNSSLKKKTGYVEIHYQKSLPAQWIECKPKKYVTNHRYGNHYEIRVDKKGRQKCPSKSAGFRFLWENDCQLWLMQNLNKVNFETQAARREEVGGRATSRCLREIPPVNNLQKNPELNFQHPSKRPRTAPVTSREIAQQRKTWTLKLATADDKANVFDQFVEWSMSNQKQREAARTIQRFVRGCLVRWKICRLKERCMKKHGITWKKFCADYKSLLARIQRRCGEPKPSCPVTYHDIELYMDKKEKYESVFNQLTNGASTLPREQIMKFFKECGLYPLEREVDAAFRAVFKGCGVQTDVVFLLDCSASIGSALYNVQLNLIKDTIAHCEISYDKVRAAVVPYNDDVFNIIDFDSYGTKEELLTELDNLTYEKAREHGSITRTDIALKCMTELVQKAYKVSDHIRDGAHIPKLCFAFTDGKCYHTQLTAKWAEYAREKLKVTLYAVTCSGEDPNYPGLFTDITGNKDLILPLTNYKTIGSMKAAIQQQECLKSCPLCHYARDVYKDDARVCSDEKRGLFKQEMLELLWMIYCPPATGLKKYKDSLWMSPQLEIDKPMKLTKYHPVGTDYQTCLKQAVEDRIEKTGKVILPTETGVKVREITDPDLAMDFIDQLCVSKLSQLGLVEKAGLDVKKPVKYV